MSGNSRKENLPTILFSSINKRVFIYFVTGIEKYLQVSFMQQ